MGRVATWWSPPRPAGRRCKCRSARRHEGGGLTARPLCDRGQALAARQRTTGHPILVMAATVLASSMDFVDGSVVNVGIPAIGRSLHGDAADLQWVVNAYLLPLSALLLLGGALGDRYGERRMLVAGVAVVAVASAACASG